MANEKRLIYANDLYQKTFICDEVAEVRKFIEQAPTVDAVVLPCKVGTQVWLTEWWGCCHLQWLKQSTPLPRNIRHFDIKKDGIFAHFHDGCINVKYFGEFVFLTREEANAALAKMDGEEKDGNLLFADMEEIIDA